MSPSAMKQTSWLSGLSATASPRRAASARIGSPPGVPRVLQRAAVAGVGPVRRRVR